MAKIKGYTNAESITLAGLEIPTDFLRALADNVLEFSKTGVVLVKEKQNIALDIDGKGRIAPYTVSLYVSRGALTQDEHTATVEVKESREKVRMDKLEAEAERLAREKRSMFQMGQDTVYSNIRNMGDIVSALSTVQKLQNVTK